jgi:hypothetical protein
MLFLLGAVACALTYYYRQAARGSHEVASSPAPARKPPQSPNAGKSVLIYPYSVIPGGVRSREELKAHMRNDTVVAAHFADFQIDKARIVKAEETKFVHVSYRIRDRIFWTSKAIKIPKGEALISDGQNVARTRCGNRVSATPEEPISGEEPTRESFDIPQLVRLESIPQLARLEIPELFGLDSGLQVPPISYLPAARSRIAPYYYRPLFVIQPDVVVPEPGTFSLLAGGLFLISVLRLFRKK